MALPNAVTFSDLVAYGEVPVGAALILGLFTGIAAFFGGVMNASYLLADTNSTNPLLFILATWLVLGWRVAGWWGLDRWVTAQPASPTAIESATVQGPLR